MHILTKNIKKMVQIWNYLHRFFCFCYTFETDFGQFYSVISVAYGRLLHFFVILLHFLCKFEVSQTRMVDTFVTVVTLLYIKKSIYKNTYFIKSFFLVKFFCFCAHGGFYGFLYHQKEIYLFEKDE